MKVKILLWYQLKKETGVVGNCKKVQNLGNLKQKLKLYAKPAQAKLFIPCNHNNKTFKCSNIRKTDALKIRETLRKQIGTEYHNIL